MPAWQCGVSNGVAAKVKLFVRLVPRTSAVLDQGAEAVPPVVSPLPVALCRHALAVLAREPLPHDAVVRQRTLVLLLTTAAKAPVSPERRLGRPTSPVFEQTRQCEKRSPLLVQAQVEPQLGATVPQSAAVVRGSPHHVGKALNKIQCSRHEQWPQHMQIGLIQTVRGIGACCPA